MSAGAATATARLPVLETERLRLRAWSDEDVAPLREILGDREVLRYFGTGPLYRAKRTAAETLARVTDLEARRAVSAMRDHWAHHGYGEWAAEDRATGRLLGKIGFICHSDWKLGPSQIEIGWTLERSAWGRGLATEGARVALDEAFGRMGLEWVISVARRDNARSVRVMEKLGMDREGLARWHGSDMVWYSLSRGAWREKDARTTEARR
jgi:RimJ/RimL family protein N-acetyltransferase